MLCSSQTSHHSNFLSVTLLGKLAEELGCRDIVGVDRSAEMIASARATEEAHPLGIVHHVSDVRKLAKPERVFDIVVAVDLLHYTKTIDELERRIQVIGEQLNASEKAYFFSINMNVRESNNIVYSDGYRKDRSEADLPLVDGSAIKNTIINKNGSSFTFTTSYFPSKIYARAFQKTGFKHFEWVSVIVASDVDRNQESLHCPDIISILAHK